MSLSLPLLVAVAGPAEAPLVRSLDAAPGLVVVRRCADLVELLAAAAAGHGRAALVSADLHRLDGEAVARLTGGGNPKGGGGEGDPPRRAPRLPPGTSVRQGVVPLGHGRVAAPPAPSAVAHRPRGRTP